MVVSLDCQSRLEQGGEGQRNQGRGSVQAVVSERTKMAVGLHADRGDCRGGVLGDYNMDIPEASACTALVNARHSIPYHMAPGKLFDAERAAQFEGPGRMIVAAGEEIVLER